MAAKLRHKKRGFTVEIIGGPESVIRSFETALTALIGYERVAGDETPAMCVVVDAMDEHPDDVALAYVRNSIARTSWPVPLIVTARPARFRCRGLAWDEEFLFGTAAASITELDVRLRMLHQMWGGSFPADVVRDSVVGTFRMMMDLDGDDYHRRSPLVDDLQRNAEWDGREPLPPLCIATDERWEPRLPKEHPFARLFQNAYSQIVHDLQQILLSRKDYSSRRVEIRDRANTVLSKIPRTTGRAVHAIASAKPHVLVIDDEAPVIVEGLRRLRIGFEADSTTLGDLFHFVPEKLSLHRKPAEDFDAESWIRERVTGEQRPGGALVDFRCADLILLDLSLEQSQDSELAGFVLLEKLRRDVPEIPLIIHTASAALSHIIEAIRNGADWYVRKDAALAYSDLASILQDIGRRPAWRRRRGRLQRERNVLGLKKLEEQGLGREEYLYVWRALTRELPPGSIFVRPYSTGKSGAVTCSVELPELEPSSTTTGPRPVPTVVAKIDRPYVMISERERFRRLIRPLIGNRAGRIDSDVVYAGATVAGIAYTLSGLHQAQDAGTSIQPLIEFLMQRLASGDPTFAGVARVFYELLYDLLPALHNFSTSSNRAVWADPIFDETLTLRDSHELRLPPLVELDLSEVGDPVPAGAPMPSLTIGAEIQLPLCRVQKYSDSDLMVLFRDERAGHLHRARLTGDVARFMARFRTLRPSRALAITGRVVALRDSAYDTLRQGTEQDLSWLAQHQYPDPTREIDWLLEQLTLIPSERVGIIHGDLNLNNILIDVDRFGVAVRGGLWLIDFARTRRDSLAHDFAELEAETAVRLLVKAGRVKSTHDMVALFGSFDAGPLHDRQGFDALDTFVSDACQFIRRAASTAKISRREYMATLAMYYLTMLKLHAPGRTGGSEEDARQARRWCIAGAATAIREIEAAEPATLASSSARLPVLRTAAETEVPPRWSPPPTLPQRRYE